MTSFEQHLIDKGYIKFSLNMKTAKFECPRYHTISTMVNLDHRYIHKDDTEFLSLIEDGVSVMDSRFTPEIRKREIVFGLHENEKPATLIYPRPKIILHRTKENRVEDERSDDAMNVVLQEVDFDTIYQAMFDKSKVIELSI